MDTPTKRLVSTLLLLTIGLGSVAVQESGTFVLTDGRFINLQEDGTYTFIDNDAVVRLIITDVVVFSNYEGRDENKAEIEYRIENHVFGALHNMQFSMVSPHLADEP